ncbi:hypothetical protein IWW48_005860 [Coemansia sp. RSA 1200]|nr:hypothetical protein IWW48_005860 [Coemansia sp. RSA 1200]
MTPGPGPPAQVNKVADVELVQAIKLPLKAVADHAWVVKIRQHADKTNTTVTRALELARWIFVRELNNNPSFDLEAHIKQPFFYAVFCALTSLKPRAKAAPNPAQIATTQPDVAPDSAVPDAAPTAQKKYTIADFRALVGKYLPGYLRSTEFKVEEFRSASQTANYEAMAMVTQYVNGVKNHLGPQLRRTINHALGSKARAAALRQQMTGRPDREVRQAIELQVWAPARALKGQLKLPQPDPSELDDDGRRVLDLLTPIYDTYRTVDGFAQDSIYYDVKLHPERHIQAFWELSRVQEQLGLRALQPFPTRTKCTPRHTVIDRAVLCGNIVEGVPASETSISAWARVLNIGHKAFRTRNGYQFRGVVQCDGLSISILKTKVVRLPVYKPPAEQKNKQLARAVVAVVAVVVVAGAAVLGVAGQQQQRERRRCQRQRRHRDRRLKRRRDQWQKQWQQSQRRRARRLRRKRQQHRAGAPERAAKRAAEAAAAPKQAVPAPVPPTPEEETAAQDALKTRARRPKQQKRRRRRALDGAARGKAAAGGVTAGLTLHENAGAFVQPPTIATSGIGAASAGAEVQTGTGGARRGAWGAIRRQDAAANIPVAAPQTQQPPAAAAEEDAPVEPDAAAEPVLSTHPKHVYWAGRRFKEAMDKVQWITDLPKEELEKLLSRMISAMAVRSTAEKPVTFRATGCQRRKSQRVRRFSDIRRKAANENKAVLESERRLAEHSWLGREDTDASTCQSVRATTPEAYERYVVQHSKEWATLRDHYYDCPTRNHGRPTQPVHRKLELSAYLNRVQAERRLADKLRAVFGTDCIVVLGDWSAPMSKFHEPIKGIGLRRSFQRHGFRLLMIREAFTSTWCPHCEDGRLERYKWVSNPRPWMYKRHPTVMCHGLLRCPAPTRLDENGKETGRRRHYNRDLAAVLNFRLIAESLAEGKGSPSAFATAPTPTAAPDPTASQPTDNSSRVPQPAPDDSGSTSGTSTPHKRRPASEPAARAPKRPCANSNGSSAHINPNNELLRGCYRYRRQA